MRERNSTMLGSVICLVLLYPSGLLGAARGDEVVYVGGTVKNVVRGEHGYINVDDQTMLAFRGAAGVYFIPFSSISSLEFGQKVRHRVGTTMALAAAGAGVAAFPLLLSKKKRHYLTITFASGVGTPEVMVFELAKGLILTTIPVIEARSGKKVELQKAVP
jgi:hypothetical protein